jgi:hypothetical protein
MAPLRDVCPPPYLVYDAVAWPACSGAAGSLPFLFRAWLAGSWADTADTVSTHAVAAAVMRRLAGPATPADPAPAGAAATRGSGGMLAPVPEADVAPAAPTPAPRPPPLSRGNSLTELSPAEAAKAQQQSEIMRRLKNRVRQVRFKGWGCVAAPALFIYKQNKKNIYPPPPS